jgi:hypothetical protein
MRLGGDLMFEIAITKYLGPAARLAWEGKPCRRRREVHDSSSSTPPG